MKQPMVIHFSDAETAADVRSGVIRTILLTLPELGKEEDFVRVSELQRQPTNPLHLAQAWMHDCILLTNRRHEVIDLMIPKTEAYFLYDEPAPMDMAGKKEDLIYPLGFRRGLADIAKLFD